MQFSLDPKSNFTFAGLMNGWDYSLKKIGVMGKFGESSLAVR